MAGRARIAVVGAGYFSRFHYDAWSRIEAAELVAACDLDRAKVADVATRHGIAATFTDLATMLDTVKPDILDIATPPATHLPAIRLAAERSVAVICQKAFCRDLAEAEAAVALAAKSGIPLIVHENFRFQPWHREIRRQLEDGRVGELFQITFRMRPGDGQGPRAYLDRQPYFQQMERFLVHETGIHFIDVFRFLAGEIGSVYADLRRLNPVIRGEDAGCILFSHANGVRSVLDGNRLSDHAARNRRLTMGEMWVEGSAGTLRLDGDARLFWRPHGGNDEQPVDYPWEDIGFAGDCVRATQIAALDAILGRAEPANSGAEYLKNLQVEAAVYTSAEEGRRVSLSPIDRGQ